MVRLPTKVQWKYSVVTLPDYLRHKRRGCDNVVLTPRGFRRCLCTTP